MSSIWPIKWHVSIHSVPISEFRKRRLVHHGIEIHHQHITAGWNTDILWERIINASLQFPGIGWRTWIKQVHRRAADIQQLHILLPRVFVWPLQALRVKQDFN